MRHIRGSIASIEPALASGTMLSAQRSKAGRSAGGVPINSWITVSGSGRAKAATRSTGTPSANSASIASSRASTASAMSGAIASTPRLPKAFSTSARTRRWSGASIWSIVRVIARSGPGNQSSHAAKLRLPAFAGSRQKMPSALSVSNATS